MSAPGGRIRGDDPGMIKVPKGKALVAVRSEEQPDGSYRHFPTFVDAGSVETFPAIEPIDVSPRTVSRGATTEQGKLL